jgi:Secretion system C-terminal sorting domain
MKKTFFILMFMLCLFSGHAQQNYLSAGGTGTGAGGKVDYSIGQIVYTYKSAATGSINQGVQQPFNIALLGEDVFPEIKLQMLVYPNPTEGLLNLSIGNFNNQNLVFYLSDNLGKQIMTKKINAFETNIDMQNFEKATYFLQVFEDNKPIKTFKIIKN